MPWGYVVCSPVMVNDFYAEHDRIVIILDLRIGVRSPSGDELWFHKLCRAAFLASRQLIITGIT